MHRPRRVPTDQTPQFPQFDANPRWRAWVGVVSQAHVLRGVEGGFAQLCHGKRGPLQKMQVGDALIYYSPTTEFGAGEPLRAFTAIGRVIGAEAYAFDMGGGFVPNRRDIAYEPAVVVPVKSLAPSLHFIRDNPNWGMLARRGHFEIDLDDFERIHAAMTAKAPADQAISSDRAAPERPPRALRAPAR